LILAVQLIADDGPERRVYGLDREAFPGSVFLAWEFAVLGKVVSSPQRT
jgi:hypothetical protein